jgi:ribosomal protein L36
MKVRPSVKKICDKCKEGPRKGILSRARKPTP